MFARKFDPSVYADVLQIWDAWMAPKLASQTVASRQPPIGSSLSHNENFSSSAIAASRNPS